VLDYYVNFHAGRVERLA